MWRLVPLFPLLLCAGCASAPDWYPPPLQHPSSTQPSTVAFRHFVAMSDPHADAYLVQGFRDKSEATWRWTHDHPVLRFWLPHINRVRFTMDFSFPDVTFRQTGPVTLTFTINGKPFDRVRYDQPGAQRYSRAVPAEFLHQEGVNLVAIDPDKFATPQPGGEKLGFVLTSAGFAE